MPIVKLQRIENIYDKSMREILQILFVNKRMNPRQITKEFNRKTKFKISESYLKQLLREYDLAKKIGTYYHYNEDVIKCHKILGYYNTASIEEFIYEFYFKRAMSVGAIAERIKKDTGIIITRQGIWRWIYWSQLWARTQRKGFNLGVNRHRFSHRKVAKKIDYAHRFISYKEIQPKRLNTMKNYSYRDSTFIFGLKKLLLDKDKTHKQLADFLGISFHCVKGWCSLNNRVNRIYWNKISKFLGVKIKELFKTRPSKTQIRKLKRRSINIGTSWA